MSLLQPLLPLRPCPEGQAGPDQIGADQIGADQIGADQTEAVVLLPLPAMQLQVSQLPQPFSRRSLIITAPVR
jgi:hypothetical protein